MTSLIQFRHENSLKTPWFVFRIFATNKIWEQVFKNGTSKTCGRQPLKKLKGYGLLKQTISLQIF